MSWCPASPRGYSAWCLSTAGSTATAGNEAWETDGTRAEVRPMVEQARRAETGGQGGDELGACWLEIAVAFGTRELSGILLQLAGPQATNRQSLRITQHRNAPSTSAMQCQ